MKRKVLHKERENLLITEEGGHEQGNILQTPKIGSQKKLLYREKKNIWIVAIRKHSGEQILIKSFCMRTGVSHIHTNIHPVELTLGDHTKENCETNNL